MLSESTITKKLSALKKEEQEILKEIEALDEKEENDVARIAFFMIAALTTAALVLCFIPHGLVWLSLTMLFVSALFLLLHFTGIFSIPRLIYRRTARASKSKETYVKLYERLSAAFGALEEIVPEDEEERREKEAEITEFEAALLRKQE